MLTYKYYLLLYPSPYDYQILRTLNDGTILPLPTLIFKSLKCCFKNEEVKQKKFVLESVIVNLFGIFQVLIYEIHVLTLSIATLGSDKSKELYNCVSSA